MGPRELLAGITVEGESNGLQTFFLSNFFSTRRLFVVGSINNFYFLSATQIATRIHRLAFKQIQLVWSKSSSLLF
jgi:hypothetical protein